MRFRILQKLLRKIKDHWKDDDCTAVAAAAADDDDDYQNSWPCPHS